MSAQALICFFIHFDSVKESIGSICWMIDKKIIPLQCESV